MKTRYIELYRYFTKPITVILLLAMLCTGLHYTALFGGFRFDDGEHINFSLNYAPWQYFFVPEVMREQSWVHITPWNIFFYEIGLHFFELNPRGHYAHLLVIIWATSVATFYLLRLWISAFYAFMGAVLFLAMPATGAVSQLLMTGHYAYGLFFSILVFYFFTRGIREDKIYYSILAAFFYLLACWCKELYVPIIVILFLLPEHNWRKRIRHLGFIIAVACFYITCRLIVIQGIGGYEVDSTSFGYSVILEIVSKIFSGVSGNIWIFFFALACCVLIRFIPVTDCDRKINWLFFQGCCVTLILPLIPVISSSFSDENLRFLYFLSWSLSAGLVWFLSTNKFNGAPLLLMMLGALILSHEAVIERIVNKMQTADKEGLFLIQATSNDLLLPSNLENHTLSDLNYVNKAISTLYQRAAPLIIQDMAELIEVGEETGKRVNQFDKSCQCVNPIGIKKYRLLTESFRAKLAAGANQHFNIVFEVKGSLHPKQMTWQFSGPEGYYVLRIRELGAQIVPPSGKLSFSKFDTPQQTLHISVQLNSPNGWIARSPDFKIHTAKNDFITWNGKSAVDLTADR